MAQALLQPVRLVGRTTAGPVVENGTVTVYNTDAAGDDNGAATLYQTLLRGGAPTPLSNPITIAPADNGVVRFSALEGLYNIELVDDDTMETYRWELYPVGQSRSHDAHEPTISPSGAGPENLLRPVSLQRAVLTEDSDHSFNISDFSYLRTYHADGATFQTFTLPSGLEGDALYQGYLLPILLVCDNAAGIEIVPDGGVTLIGGALTLARGDTVTIQPMGGDVFTIRSTRSIVNKETTGDTASIGYQSGGDPVAETGLIGDDNYLIRVSSDGGATWYDAVIVNASTGSVGIGGRAPTSADRLRVIIPESGGAFASSFERYGGSGAHNFLFRKARGTVDAPTVVADGDAAVSITAQAYDGSAFTAVGVIRIDIDGVAGSDLGGVLGFVVADATGTLQTRLTIDNEGRIQINESVDILTGSGSPEGSITAPVGSLYLRDDGGAGTSLYIKEGGAGDTGWQPMSSNTMDMPAELTAAHTVTNGDLAGNVVQRINVATGVNVTVAASLTGTEPCTFIQTGAGALTFVEDTGVTIVSLDNNLVTAGQGASVTLIPDADTADLYYLVGALTS